MQPINHIWEGDADDFRRDVLDWASQFTLPNKATKAVGNIKRSCQTGPEIPFEYHLVPERELQAALFGSSDAKKESQHMSRRGYLHLKDSEIAIYRLNSLSFCKPSVLIQLVNDVLKS